MARKGLLVVLVILALFAASQVALATEAPSGYSFNNGIATIIDLEALKYASSNAKTLGITKIVIDPADSSGVLTITDTTELTFDGISVEGKIRNGVKPTLSTTRTNINKGSSQLVVLTGNASLSNLRFEKTNTDALNGIVYFGAGTMSVTNCDFVGQYVIGAGEVVRGIHVSTSCIGYTIDRCTFTALRQPAYINPLSGGGAGTITGCTVKGTRGWCLTADTKVDISGSIFENNVNDIVVLSDNMDLIDRNKTSYYADLPNLSKKNGNAYIEDQSLFVSYKAGSYYVDDAKKYTYSKDNQSYRSASFEVAFERAQTYPAPIYLQTDYSEGKALTLGENKKATIETNGKTLTLEKGMTVNGTLTLNGGGSLIGPTNGPAILNKSTNTVIINNVEITGKGSYPGVECENGRVIITQMPSDVSKLVIKMTESADSVEVYKSDATEAKDVISGDTATVSAGNKVIFYNSLGNALQDAPSGSTVTVTAKAEDVTLDRTACVDNNVTIDLNGHNVKEGENATIIVPDGETIKVVSSENKGSVVIGGVPVVNVDASGTTVEGKADVKGETLVAVSVTPAAKLYIYGLSAGQYDTASTNTVTVQVRDDYVTKFEKWTVSGEYEGTIDEKATSIRFKPTGAMTITANFKPEPAPAPAALTLSQTTASIKVGATQQLTASETGVTWSTSAATIATVKDGLVTGVAVGNATITATAADGRKAECAVTVTKADDPTDPTDPTDPGTTDGKFKSMPKTYKITVGYTFQLAKAERDGDVLNEKFKTTNKKIVSVTSAGLIKAEKVGKATISLKVGKKTHKCVVTVVANKFSRNKPLYLKGEKAMFTSMRALSYKDGGLYVEMYVYNRTARKVRGYDNYVLQVRQVTKDGEVELYSKPIKTEAYTWTKALPVKGYKKIKVSIPAADLKDWVDKGYDLAKGELQAYIIGKDSNGNEAQSITASTPGWAKPKMADMIFVDDVIVG